MAAGGGRGAWGCPGTSRSLRQGRNVALLARWLSQPPVLAAASWRIKGSGRLLARTAVEQVGARRDSLGVVGCCDHLWGGCGGCRPGGTNRSRGRGGAVRDSCCVVDCKCPFWVPGRGRMVADLSAVSCLSCCFHPLRPGDPSHLVTGAGRNWDRPAPLPGAASANAAAFWRGTHGTTHSTAPDVPGVLALWAMVPVTSQVPHLLRGGGSGPSTASAVRLGLPSTQWLLLIPILLPHCF